MASYIQCDYTPTIEIDGSFVCDQVGTPLVLSLSQAIELFSPPLSASEGALLAGLIFSVSFLSWGFRLALKQFNLGV
jgi:hypothetical protein